MARYDRIAPLALPPRERAFPGWMALRDLEGHERDAELARRVRLRYLALRPLRRLLRYGFENVPADSFERQLESVREELGHLPARDPERARLSQFLHQIRNREPVTLLSALVDLGEIIEATGHYYGAGECYQTALEVAEAASLDVERVRALRLLGRVARRLTLWTEAEEYYRRALDLATSIGERKEWARTMDGLGLSFMHRGNYPAARKLFEEVLARGRAWRDDYVVAIACNSLCENALTAGNLEGALEYGWRAVGLLRSDEDRNPVLGNLGQAFTRLRLFPAAERCYQIVAARSQQLIIRGQARTDYAVVAAEAGDAATFRARRTKLLSEAEEWQGEPFVNAWMQLHLGRGCALVGDVEPAREHLRDASSAARRHHYNEILVKAEELLTTLEKPAAPRVAERPGAVARRIAAEIENFEPALVAASA